MLRAHTSAHQAGKAILTVIFQCSCLDQPKCMFPLIAELIKNGLDNFLVVGDVYRRDTIDQSHYPVFHQMEGVRLFQAETFFDRVRGPRKHLEVFEKGVRNDHKQETHTLDSCKIVELDLKDCLLGLTKELFGQGKLLFFMLER